MRFKEETLVSFTIGMKAENHGRAEVRNGAMTDNDIIELYMRRDERAIAATQVVCGKYCEKIARKNC